MKNDRRKILDSILTMKHVVDILEDETLERMELVFRVRGLSDFMGNPKCRICMEKDEGVANVSIDDEGTLAEMFSRYGIREKDVLGDVVMEAYRSLPFVRDVEGAVDGYMDYMWLLRNIESDMKEFFRKHVVTDENGNLIDP